jgi:putative two-component system response regulator
MDVALGADYSTEIDAPFTDNLTGLYNHGFFQICLDREIKRSSRHGTPFSLALIDIDGFSVYNRTFGPLQGDRMLKDISSLIVRNIREVDLAARFLGDVYSVLFVMSEAVQVRAAAERIRSSVEAMSHGRLTVSIGLASFQRDDTKESVLEQARKALSQAKIRGKNRVHFFEKEEIYLGEKKPTILVVDDERVNLKVMEASLASLDYEVIKASNGEEALDLVQKTEVDLVLLDIMMPGMDGYEVCRRLKSSEATRLIPVVLLTALSGTEARVQGIEAGADDFLTKPPNRVELLARTKSLIKVKTLNDDLIGIENVLFYLANTIEARDAYTDGHVQRVAQMAVGLGSSMGLQNKDLKALKLGGILHDIGKINVPDAILNKPGALTPEERKIIERHADSGYRICLPLGKTLGSALDVVRYHHEKLDGSGYPDRLKGRDIPMVARIMAIVDIYDALVTDRPYRPGLSREESFKIMSRMVEEGKLDGEVFIKFLTMMTRTEA